MIISIALQNAQSIEDVVKMVNGGGTSEHWPWEIAGQYAYDAAEDKTSAKEIEAHLDILAEAGAKFSYPQVLEYIATHSI